MSRFDSFIVIDIETTGLDPSTCEIIELGAARFDKGVLIDKFSELVKPPLAIPHEITRLTGITNAAVKAAPKIDTVIAKFEPFIDGTAWVVGHNVSFDLSFLKSHFPKKKFSAIEARTLDTAVLSRVLYPRLPRYGLASLVEYFKISRRRAHRALDDCLTTGDVFLALIGHLAALAPASRESIGRLLFGADGLETFRQGLAEIKPVPKVLTSLALPEGAATEDDLFPDNVAGEAPEKACEDYLPVDKAAVENCFLPGGLLSKGIASFEYRPQQTKMAIKVAQAFNQSNFLLAEAPTGVGKSLAYLLPASWWASQNRERVIISTQTKSLQSQLFYKDLPQIQNAVTYKFKTVLLKGKSNYLCYYKYYELLAEAETGFSKRDREALASLTLWSNSTKTGDVGECHGFNPSQNQYLWSRISCEGSFCLGQACVYADRCFLLKVRREAQTAQVIVTNHHLTFADFASGGELALGAGNIIFDEAHNLEKVAASYLGNVVDKRNIDNLLSDMYASRPAQSGFLPNLKMSLLLRGSDDDLERQVDKVIDGIMNVSYASTHFFEILAEKIQTSQGGSEARDVPFDATNNPCDFAEREELLEQMGQLLERADDLLESIRELDSLQKRREIIIRLEAFSSDLKSLRAVAGDVLYASDGEYVYWIEKPTSARYAPRLLSAPLEVGKLLDKKFYDHLKTAVFTSATLTVERNFSYIIQRLGLDSSSKDRLDTICLDSPFDIDANVAVVLAGYLPSPKQYDFEAAANESLKEILTTGARKAMVLFTSHRSLRGSAESLREHLEKNGIELFSQEGSYSSDRIFRRFKAAKKAVLLGTDTFWEGVDLPGDLLELLVLFKLPFTVPDRPWFKANLEKIEKSGESSFARLSLPEAVVKFRQGFGRLIRTSQDRGCVVVLDSRLEKTSFGRVFLNSVGGTKFKCASSEQAAKTIKDWLPAAKM